MPRFTVRCSEAVYYEVVVDAVDEKHARQIVEMRIEDGMDEDLVEVDSGAMSVDSVTKHGCA